MAEANKYGLPAFDSGIVLEPGASVRLDADLGADWSDQARKLREFRGLILASTYGIEYIVDQILCLFFFPMRAEEAVPGGQDSPDIQQARKSRGLFDDLILKPMNSFHRKLEILKKTFGEDSTNPFPRDLLKKLERVKEVRNQFAHYPIAFIPEGEEPHQILVPFLTTRRQRFKIDDAFKGDIAALFASCHDELKAFNKKLDPAPPGRQPGGSDGAEAGI